MSIVSNFPEKRGLNTDDINDITNGEISNNFIQNAECYSTEEQIVGRWIDGKPIYQKTFIGLSIDLSDTKWYDTGLDATNLIPVCGCAYAGGSDNFICYINIRSISNKWYLMYPMTMGTLNILTIQYIKTTD